MKLTVLMDNNTFIDRYYLGEPALCFYIEDEEERILFDTGYSGAFIKNARDMGIDLGKLTAVVFSHGHNDHTRGFTFLAEEYDLSGVKLIAHPGVFARRKDNELEVGAPFAKEYCESLGMRILDGSGPVKLTSNLWFLGTIRRTTAFEGGTTGMILEGNRWLGDPVSDDSALVYQSSEGPFVITGCSHSGICNIIRSALDLCGGERVSGLIGGLHLLRCDERLKATIDFLKAHTAGPLYACHCVSLAAKCEMMKQLLLQEVGVGLSIEI